MEEETEQPFPRERITHSARKPLYLTVTSFSGMYSHGIEKFPVRICQSLRLTSTTETPDTRTDLASARGRVCTQLRHGYKTTFTTTARPHRPRFSFLCRMVNFGTRLYYDYAIGVPWVRCQNRNIPKSSPLGDTSFIWATRKS